MGQTGQRRVVRECLWIAVVFTLAMFAFPAPKLVKELVQECQDVEATPHTALHYVAINKWGSAGSGNGQFNLPEGIAMNSSGYVFVADSGNNRMQVFNQTGGFVRTWGSAGSGNGSFGGLKGVETDSLNHVYTVEASNHRVQDFNGNTGQWVNAWGSYGTGNGQFDQPYGIAMNPASTFEDMYVTDMGNNRIQYFYCDGLYQGQWGSYGTGNGQFNMPQGIAINSTGYVYVADMGNNRVQIFDSTGGYVAQWGSLIYPSDIEIDASGNVYVVENGGRRVSVFTPTGQFLLLFGGSGTGDGQFQDPSGIDINASGFAYVVDTWNYRVQVFCPDVYPPIITQIVESADPLELGSTAWVHAYINDTFNTKFANLERGGVNYTLQYWDNGWWNFSGWVPSSLGVINYTVWACDYDGNWGAKNGSITVIDTVGPVLTFNESSNPLELGGMAWVHANFSDLSGVNKINFEREGVNKSMLYDDDIDLWVSPTWTPTSLGVINYTLWTRDTEGNWAFYNLSMNVVDSVGPAITLVESADPLELGNTAWVRASVVDNTVVDTVIFERDGVNSTMTDEGEEVWFSGTWVPTDTGPIAYTVWANDTSGNWGNKSGTITVQDTVAPSVTPAVDLFITTPVVEGHFIAMYSFTSSAVGMPPTGFTPYTPAQTSCRVNGSYAGHANVLELADGNSIDYCGARTTFAGQPTGVIESYLAVTAWGGENCIAMLLENVTGESGLELSLHGGALELWTPAETFVLAGGLNAGEFYHVRVAFDCPAGTCQVWLNGSLVGNCLFNGPAQGTVAGVSFRTSVSNLGGMPYSGCVDAVDFSWDFSYDAWRGMPHVAWDVTDACAPDVLCWNVTRNGVRWRNGTGKSTGIVPLGFLAGGDIVLEFNVTDGYNMAGDVAIGYINQMPQINVTVTLVEYPIGMVGHVIFWTITDREATDARRYTVYKNGTPWSLVDNEWMSGAKIPLSVDGLGYGDHAITLVAKDGYGGQNASTVIVRVWDPYTNGTWQDVRVGLQVITCTRWGVTHAELDIDGLGPALKIRVTAFRSGAFPAPLEGALAYIEVALDGPAAGARWPANGRFYYDPAFLGAADEGNLALYRREGSEWVLVAGTRVNVDGHFLVADCPGAGEYAIAPGPIVYDPTTLMIVLSASAMSLGALVVVQRKGTIVIWQRRRAVKRSLESLDHQTSNLQGSPSRGDAR